MRAPYMNGAESPLLSAGLDVVAGGTGSEDAVRRSLGFGIHHCGAYLPMSLACASTCPCMAKYSSFSLKPLFRSRTVSNA